MTIIETLASEVRGRRYDIPVDPVALAEKYRLEVWPWPAVKTDFVGALVRSSNLAVIFYAERLSAGRRRFTIAHEIGHYLLPGHDEEACYCAESGGRCEVEANRFAAALLMPKRDFESLWYEHRRNPAFRTEALAYAFLVSFQAARVRVRALQLV